jgi:hypothetical protein
VDVSVDDLWDALREHCCATKPFTDAKVIVQLRRDDLAAAMGAIAEKALPEHGKGERFCNCNLCLAERIKRERETYGEAGVDQMRRLVGLSESK